MIDVLYLHNSSLISGGERSLLQLWASFDRSQFVPHLLLPGEGVFAKEARRLGIDVGFLNVPSLRAWLWGGFLKAERELKSFVAMHDIRLIHSYAPCNNLLASRVGRAMHIPVIWHERNMCWKHEVDFSKIFLAEADGVICNSLAVARRFEADGLVNEKVRVILNGVDVDYFVPPANQEALKRKLGWGGKKVLGCVANLEPRKGVDVFLQIASRVLPFRQDVLFVVVGGLYGGGDRRVKELKDLAKMLQVDKNVVWAGFQDDIRPFAQAFDVLVHVTEKEACSRAILESMAMRLAVVAFDDGGNPELVVEGKTGLLVPVGELDVFAQRLGYLLEHDVECAKMGHAARERVVSLFNARRCAAQTESFYNELLKR